MAITKTIEIDVNELKAVGGLENLDKAIKKVDSSATNLDATFEEVYGDLKPLTARMGEAEDRLYELANAGQTASKEYKDLLEVVGNYRKTQIQTDLAVDAAATTMSQKMVGGLQGAANAFSVVESTMALTGIQSKEFEETMIRLQAAMALSQGIQGLKESSNVFLAMGRSAKTALSGIRTGIAATGIGVLVLALGAIVAYWDDIKSAVNGVSSEQEKLNAQVDANLKMEQSKLDNISSQDNVLKLQGKSEKDILKLKIGQVDAVIQATEAQIKQNDITAKSQIEAAQRNKDILKGILDFLSIPFQTVLKTIDMIGSAVGKDFGLSDGFQNLLDKGSSLIFDPEAEKQKAEETRKESLKSLDKLKNDRAGFQMQINAIDKTASDNAKAKQKEDNDKAIELAKQKADALERIRQGEIDTEAERRAEELRQIQEQYKTLISEADKYGVDTLALKEAQRTKENELKDKWKAEDEQKELDYWNAEAEKAIARQDEAKKKADEEIAIEQAKADAKKAIQDATLTNIEGGIGLLKQLGEKNKGVQKAALLAESAVGVARIIQNTQAANAKSVAASPLTGGQPWVTINTISGALGIASSLLATRKALSQLGGGSASGGTLPNPTSGGTQAPAPQFNVVGNSGVNQIAQTLGQQQPVQAYVVANNVTTAQSLNRNIVANASLG